MTAPGIELSVVIAAYDAEATLAEQLDALAAQTVPFAWEVIVADNGSGDRTVALALDHADRLPLRVVDASATKGAGAARNVGVGAARAPLVAFCDADDVVGEGWLVAMRDALRHSDFVAGRFEGHRLNTPAVLRTRTMPQQDGLQESRHMPGLRAAGAGNLGIAAHVLRAVGGFDVRTLFLEDADLCWRVQLAGVPLAWAPDAVVHVRLRGRMWSSVRQGYDYGTGERWLALRYREQESRLRALAASSGDGATAADGGASAARAVPLGRLVRPGLRRVLHRTGATLAALARVRSLGELGAWAWDLGWGLGFAFGRVPVPEPVAIPEPIAAPAPAPDTVA